MSDPGEPKVTRRTRTEADGTHVETVEMRLDGDSLRPVDDAAVTAFDGALSALGELLHAIDPARIVRFEQGGPPVWSVGCVRVDGPHPHKLFVTYGFSDAITAGQGFDHELSVAAPMDDDQADVWGPALLRHLARYVLRTGAELCVHDNMPLGASVTRAAFAPEHHGAFADSSLQHVVVADDPTVGPVDTPSGRVSVRRVYALHRDEAALLDVWSAAALLEELRGVDPRLVTDVRRPSRLDDPAVRARCEARARAEGGSVGMVFVEGGFAAAEGGALELYLPGGAQAEQFRRVFAARLPYGRDLRLVGPPDLGDLWFVPAPAFEVDVDWDQPVLILRGPADDPRMQQLLAAFDPGGDGRALRLTFGG